MELNTKRVAVKSKLKLIYLPFLVMTISFIVIYSFLHWLLFIKTDTLSFKQSIVDFWLPFVLPWIPVLLWFRSRVNLLKLKTKNGDLPMLYFLVVALSMSIPTFIAQQFIETASGTLTKLENINQIAEHENTKYYTLKNYYIDKSNIGVFHSFDVSGKANQNFNMHLYVVMPILKSIQDTASASCSAWLAIKYNEQIKNRLKAEEKEQKYKSFVRNSQQDFNNKKVDQFIYMDREGNTNDCDGYKEAIKKNKKYATPDNAPIFIGVGHPFEKRNGNKLAWVFGAYGIANGIWLIMLLIPKLNTSAVRRFEKGTPSKHNEFKEFLDFVKPKEGFWVTPLLIYLNIFIFLIMAFVGLGFISFKGQDLLTWGANYRPLTTNGEWWRLLTSVFLHGGFIHLFSNMYALLFVGIFLEPLLGKIRYILVYVLTGIIASCASLWWHDATVSVGASGAIFGLYGLFIALLLTKVFPSHLGKAFLLSVLLFIGYNLLMGIMGGIDNAAHIGGLISGFIIGIILYPKLKKQVDYKHPLKNNSQ